MCDIVQYFSHLACSICINKVVQRIYSIKRRPRNKRHIVAFIRIIGTKSKLSNKQ